MVPLRLRRRFARIFFGTSTVSVPKDLDLMVDSTLRNFLCPVQYAEKYGSKPTEASETKDVELSDLNIEESPSSASSEEDGSEQAKDRNMNTSVLKRCHRMPLCALPMDAQGYWYFAIDEKFPSYNLYQQLYGNPTTRPWGIKVFPNIPSPRNRKQPHSILYTPADMTANEEVTTVYITTWGKLPRPGTYGFCRKEA